MTKETAIISGAAGKPILIDITYLTSNVKSPVVLYLHGFNGFKDWGNFDLIARQFVAAGFCFVKFNCSHNGTSPEQPEDFVDLDAFAENNYSKELEDLHNVIQWLSDADNPFTSFISPEQIGLIGHSMGGGISIIKTAEDNRIKALATWAAISACKTPWGNWPPEKMDAWKTSGVAYYFNGRTQQQMPMHYQLFLDFENNQERLNIPSAAGRIKVPFLICHGTTDTSVPVESAHLIHAQSPHSEIFLVDSDHVFGRKHPWPEAYLPEPMQQIVDRNIDFFKTNL